jgi:zinc protease
LEKTLATMYQWHNYGKSTIGARTDVENVDIGRLQAFYRLHYQPDNATLVVTGKFDSAKVLAWVPAASAPLPKPQARAAAHLHHRPGAGRRAQVTVRRRVAARRWPPWLPRAAGRHPDFAAVDAAPMVLGDTAGGRLHKRLVETKLAASSFAFGLGAGRAGPVHRAQLAPGQDVDKAAAHAGHRGRAGHRARHRRRTGARRAPCG